MILIEVVSLRPTSRPPLEILSGTTLGGGTTPAIGAPVAIGTILAVGTILTLGRGEDCAVAALPPEIWAKYRLPFAISSRIPRSHFIAKNGKISQTMQTSRIKIGKIIPKTPARDETADMITSLPQLHFIVQEKISAPCRSEGLTIPIGPVQPAFRTLHRTAMPLS